MFKRKSETEKFLEKVKKQKLKISKLEEELKKMVKFGIKDGKLVPKIEGQENNNFENTDTNIQQKEIQNTQQDNRFSKEELYRKMVEREVQKMRDSSGNIDNRQQQEQQYVEQNIPPIQPQMQTQYKPMKQQQVEPQIVAVKIILNGGVQFTAQVPEEYLQTFFSELNTAIAEQSPFQLDNTQVLNGRYILYYGF